MKIKCDYCGSTFKQGNRPDGYPNGVGFQLQNGSLINICYHCVCTLPTNTKMQKWLEDFRKEK